MENLSSLLPRKTSVVRYRGILVKKISQQKNVMVENAKDVTGETEPNFVEISGDVKPPKDEAEPNIDGAFVHVEASKYVDSGVVPLQAHEVDTHS
ncbi:hypothetical protein MTR_1g081020 [Medicago truncatula]|uniref:Uncharacterized protein n=1 Tax=Medicago truncatula TaxID=3880 RepID=A0A072VMH9_MEDTR|nr:hypothetical protein MTR_1g081020 [Medicago truncatula]